MAKDFWAERIAQLEAEQKAAQLPAPPMYSPEEVASRLATNKRQEAMGALGVMSGDKPMGALGGTYLKQAMSDRAEKTTASGQVDPLRGNMKYFPQYLQQRQSERTDKGLDRAYEQQARARDRAELAAGRKSNAAAIAGAITGLGTGSNLPIGVTPKGAPIFRAKDGSNLYTYDKGKPQVYEGPMLRPQDLPSAVAQKVAQKEAYMTDHDDFSKTWKDEYAGTAPLIGEVESKTGRYTGGPAEAMSRWWQAYNNWTINIRRDLFGTALTAPEKELFNEANIFSGMPPSVVRYNLKRQKRAMALALNRLKEKYPERYGSTPVEVPPAPDPAVGGGGWDVWRTKGPLGSVLKQGYDAIMGNEPAAPTAAPAPRQALPQANPQPQPQPLPQANPQPAPQPGAQQGGPQKRLSKSGRPMTNINGQWVYD